MNLNMFMENGIKGIMKTMGRFYIKSAKGRAFLAHMLPCVKKSAKIREEYEENGTHIPAFLIASIASQCNLNCTGCYSRASGACGSDVMKSDLTAKEWQSVFKEASQLGIAFILLAGGEPFMRRDVIEIAAQTKNMIFPVFTNGTMLDEESLTLLNESRNLVPVLSIEGGADETDKRRGSGTYSAVHEAMRKFKEKDILFGVSITVSSENLHMVTAPSFVSHLRDSGCGLVFFVEYVPISEGTRHLALNQDDLEMLSHSISALKKSIDDMIILSFPGDEVAMGGCLASGRGFFHINSSGGAEPCPFSPYAKQNLKTSGILEVLESEYFSELREIAKNAGEHTGGCTLFEQNDKVTALNKSYTENAV